MGIATDLLPWKNTGKSPWEIYDTLKLSWSFWPPKKYKYIKLYIDWWEKAGIYKAENTKNKYELH